MLMSLLEPKGFISLTVDVTWRISVYVHIVLAIVALIRFRRVDHELGR